LVLVCPSWEFKEPPQDYNLVEVFYFNVSEFQSLFKKYYKKTLQGATELTEIHGDFFGWIIWRLYSSV